MTAWILSIVGSVVATVVSTLIVKAYERKAKAQVRSSDGGSGQADKGVDDFGSGLAAGLTLAALGAGIWALGRMSRKSK